MTGNPLRWASARATLVALALLLGCSHELEILTPATTVVHPDLVRVEQRATLQDDPASATKSLVHETSEQRPSFEGTAITSRPGVKSAPSEGTSARPGLRDSVSQLQISPSPPCGQDRLCGSQNFSRKDRKGRKDVFSAIP
ncbi:MAG: hypothetical protein ACMG6S_19400, partial [Byssovorax sp.]